MLVIKAPRRLSSSGGSEERGMRWGRRFHALCFAICVPSPA